MLLPNNPLDLILNQLTPEQRQTVIDFARFLARENERRGKPAGTGEAASDAPPSEPLGIPRPAGERPVDSLRRLKRNYPMLSQEDLFSEAATLMMRHHLMRADAEQVIEQMEALFARAFEAWQAGQG